MDQHQVSSRSSSPSNRYRADQHTPQSDAKVLPTDKMIMLLIVGTAATPLFRMGQSAPLFEFIFLSIFVILVLMITNGLVGKFVSPDGQ